MANAYALYAVARLPDLPLRRRYWLVIACNLTQLLCGCRSIHAAYPPNQNAGPLLGLFCVASGNGAIYLLAFTKLTPLPFRWQLPLLAAMTCVVLSHTADYCTNHLLKQGYAVINLAARSLLPIFLPGAVDLLPPEGFMTAITAAVAAPTGGDSWVAALLCERLQAGMLLVCSAAIATHLYHSELQRRLDFQAGPQLRANQRTDGDRQNGSPSSAAASRANGGSSGSSGARGSAGRAVEDEAGSSS